MLEDTVVGDLCALLEHRRFRTLAQGGNQAARFRFRTSHGRSKSPDAVFVKDALLLVVEVKVRASDLFRIQNGRRESDADIMSWLAASADTKATLLQEAERTIAAGRISYLAPPTVVECAVASGTNLAPFAEQLQNRKISGFYVKDSTLHLSLITGVLQKILAAP